MPKRDAQTKRRSTSSGRRLGRPPATDGAETRRRLLEIALGEFAEQGYSDATLKAIAVKAGLTTGAVYHYFPSKVDLFLAVGEMSIDEFTSTLDEQAEGAKTFVEQLYAALEGIAILNARLPDMAPFLSNLETESRRYPELRDIHDRLVQQRDAYYRKIVMDAVDRGEITKQLDPQAVIDLVEAFRLGMARFSAQTRSIARHRALITAFEFLLDGDLIVRTGPGRSRARRARAF